MCIRKIFLLIFVVLVLTSSVYAFPFNVEAKVINNVITLGESASFNITIENNLNEEETFKVRTLDYPTWDISSKPPMNPILLDIPPLKEKSIEITLMPLTIRHLGVYNVNVQIKQQGKKEGITLPLRVNLVSPKAGKYVETVIATIVMDDKVDPTKELITKVKLDNQNIIKYPNITIKLDSKFIKEERSINLGSKEKKTITFRKTLDPLTKPQEDILVVTVFTGNTTLDTKIKRFEIVPHKEVKKKEKIEKSFLKKTIYLTYTNIGNVPYKGTAKINSSFFESLFMSSRPRGKFIKENNLKLLTWTLDIEPGESTEIIVVYNYITLLIIIFLLVVITSLYYILRSPLVIQKKATNIMLKEGGVSELKVVLNVKNRGKTMIKNISIVDKIPNIADIEKGITIGTLQPTKILKHEHKGTIIKWLIDEIEPGDERVISYKIRSHLSILGEFALSPAIAKFRIKGKERITHSNSLTVTP